MKTQHTARAWTLNHNTNWKTNPFSITVRGGGVHSTTIANIPTRMTIPPQEQQANARLIAAAPDLLNVLQLLVRPHGGTVAVGADNELAIKARTAIAKATGAKG